MTLYCDIFEPTYGSLPRLSGSQELGQRRLERSADPKENGKTSVAGLKYK